MKVGISFVVFILLSVFAVVALIVAAFKIRKRQKNEPDDFNISITTTININED